MENQKVKELVNKLREELGTNLTENANQYLTQIEEITTEDSEEDKKLFEELGISADLAKKKVAKEVQRLTELFSSQNNQKISVIFATEKVPREKLGDKEGITVIPENEVDGYNIYLQLERKDKDGNFCPSLIFWTFTWELATINLPDKNTGQKNPDFWKNFDKELEWVKDNLIVLPIVDREKDFRCQFELLLNPSTFPTEKLEISELLAVYFPNTEIIINNQNLSSKIVGEEIINEVWSEVWKKAMELTSEEVKKNPSEEELKKLAIKVYVGSNSNGYSVFIQQHPESSIRDKIEKLIETTPLKLENENLKKEKEQLPSPENFEKLTKKNQLLENYLQDLTDEEKFKEIKEKIEKND